MTSMIDRCDCHTGPLPGVFYNPTTGTVQRCDSCTVFEGDLEAAAALAARYGGRIHFHAEGDPDGADPRVYDPATGFDGLTAEGTDPWLDPPVSRGPDGWRPMTADDPPAAAEEEAEQNEITEAGRMVEAAQRRYAELHAARAARRIRSAFPTAAHAYFFVAQSSFPGAGPYAEIAAIRDDQCVLLACSESYQGADGQDVTDSSDDSDWSDPLATAHGTGNHPFHLDQTDPPIETPNGQGVWVLDIKQALAACSSGDIDLATGIEPLRGQVIACDADENATA